MLGRQVPVETMVGFAMRSPLGTLGGGWPV